jgi:hypothetical protein
MVDLIGKIVFKNIGVPECRGFATVLFCDGERDCFICTRCGNGWTEPCKHKKLMKGKRSKNAGDVCDLPFLSKVF